MILIRVLLLFLYYLFHLSVVLQQKLVYPKQLFNAWLNWRREMSHFAIISLHFFIFLSELIFSVFSSKLWVGSISITTFLGQFPNKASLQDRLLPRLLLFLLPPSHRVPLNQLSNSQITFHWTPVARSPPFKHSSGDTAV